MDTQPTGGRGPVWAPVWEGPRALAAVTEKILTEHGITFIEEAGEQEGRVQIRVPWDSDEHAKELLRGS